MSWPGSGGRHGSALRPWATALSGAVLIALLVGLIRYNYASATRIQTQVLGQHQQAFRVHALALSHLLSSADDQLRFLAASSEVAAFHESRDLGMSMAYGLGLALVPIRLRLAALVRSQEIGEGLFAGVMLLDADGSRLASSGDVGPPPRPSEDGLAPLSVDVEGTARVLVARPVTSKDRRAGWIVGWIRPGRIGAALGQESTGRSRFALLDEAGHVLEPGPPEAHVPPLPPGLVRLPEDGRLVPLADPWDGELALAQRLPVPGHSLTLVDVDRRSDLLGGRSPLFTTVALSVAAAVVLALVGFAVLAGNRAVALQVRLDESQRREAEVAAEHAALEKADGERMRLWQAVSQSPAIVVIADRSGRIEYVNPTFERVTGHSGRDVVGDSRLLVATRTAGGGDPARIFSTIQKGDTWYGEVRNRRADGKPLWLSVAISPARSERGEITHYIAIGEDATARTLAARELARARDAAEAANRAKSAFLASMSHEIRTPLNAILGYSQLTARDPSLSPGSRHNLETINRSGEHLLALLNQVLEISKIEAGRAHVERSAFDLGALLQDLEAMFAFRARSKGLAFEVAGPSGPGQLLGDEAKIRQVLVNLAGNAVKFTARGHVRVEVSLPAAGDGLRLVARVSDTGPGIAAEELPNLFQEFEQTATGKALQSGTGLGLALSRSLARLLGGDLRAASAAGQGAEFTFDVPVERSTLPALARTSGRVVGLAGAGRPPRVLVVDDEETNRDWLCQVLRAVGFEVREASDGAVAVAACAERWADVVLMDLRMPGLDGVEATRRIRAGEGGSEVAVIALTASAFEADRSALLAAGAQAVLAKPIRERDLLDTIGGRLGLTYRTEDAPLPAAVAAAAAAEALTPDGLAALPRELRDRMREATRRGDVDRLGQLIDEAAADAAPAAQGLRALASRYDFEGLKRALA